MMKYLIGAGLMSLAISSWAQTNWKCHNAVLLDLCQNASCFQNRIISMNDQVLHVRLDNQRNLTICTQSSCWRGQVQAADHSSSGILQLREINWKDADPNKKQNFLLSINPTSKTLFFDGKDSKHPLQCQVV